MKQETATSADRLRALLQMYALALLLAMFISALHAGILFSLGDFVTWLRHWARPALGGRPTDILVVLAAISGLFVAHIAEASMWAAFFWKSGHLASFGLRDPSAVPMLGIPEFFSAQLLHRLECFS
jgi:hypothetical protein